jgi:hypothetical protein
MASNNKSGLKSTANITLNAHDIRNYHCDNPLLTCASGNLFTTVLFCTLNGFLKSRCKLKTNKSRLGALNKKLKVLNEDGDTKIITQLAA